MDKQEATKLIAEKTKAAQDLLKEATQISEESGVSFYFSMSYTDYEYIPQKLADERKNDDWYSSLAGWVSSSDRC